MRWPNQRIFLPLLVLLFISFPLSPQATDSQTAWVNRVIASDTFPGKVAGVSDGDTISVMRGGRVVKVCLHGIDYPEKKQAFGKKAKQCTSDLAFGKEVTVHIQSTDRYGRTVGVVILPDCKNLNRELVSAGLAWWYRKYAPASND